MYSKLADYSKHKAKYSLINESYLFGSPLFGKHYPILCDHTCISPVFLFIPYKQKPQYSNDTPAKLVVLQTA